MSNGSLYTEIQKNIATVEFYHPASNSMPKELLERLAKTFNELSNNNEVSVIVLKSEKDKAFCAGASFDELVNIDNFEQGKEFFLGFANVINAMRTCSKLIIGRVQGKAVGGGVGLAAACDYCFATEASSIKLSEFTIGIGPFVIAPVVERKMGVAALSELTIDATSWKNAYWAQKKGLYSNVFENIKDMDFELDVLLNKLSNYNPKALREMKRVFWSGTEDWGQLLENRAEISGKLVLSEFTKDALNKFKK
ncbi:enoyl-CoA hydratase/isomerase family protein [Lutibacter citreus]|uniref:enoyl-CoA hydratase/isomerase family protein n=1 Tax=Lutibacter citreus TaxID=2138210 RepID=UPI000DBE1C4A|nr:enoyl-CoA hydratase/isomerase family protein [Lutibacter citreus]